MSAQPALVRRHRVYVVAGLAEREGARRRNTAVFLDRTGAVVGKYHKSHLTIRERMINGITEGDELPVFDTDFGGIGLLTCWDCHFPEPARILALKGAELIVMPNAGDDVANFTGQDVGKRYLMVRRPDIYEALLQEFGGEAGVGR